MRELSGQRFSPTDLAKTDDIGIVFPLKTAKDTLSFSHIVDLKEDKCCIKHSEVRIVNSTKDEVVYEKGRALTYVEAKELVINPSEVERNILNIDTKYIPQEYVVLDDIKLNSTLKDIINKLKKIKFTPEIFIDKNSISKKNLFISYKRNEDIKTKIKKIAFLKKLDPFYLNIDFSDYSIEELDEEINLILKDV